MKPVLMLDGGLGGHITIAAHTVSPVQMRYDLQIRHGADEMVTIGQVHFWSEMGVTRGFQANAYPGNFFIGNYDHLVDAIEALYQFAGWRTMESTQR